MVKCFICGNEVYGSTRITCSDSCHEEMVNRLQNEFGKYKKVARMLTGEVFKVPLRDIIEKSVREQDLDKYPRWENGNSQ